ncbi:MAG: oligosaccharide flippase family protein [Methylotenera sp.]
MSLKKNVIANFLGQGWTALMGLAFIPLYIQYLGVEAYGLIGFYAVMQAWLTLFDMGITQTLNREMARFTAGAHTPQSIHDLLRSLEVIAVVLAIVMCLLVWASSSYIATHWLNAQKLSSDEVATAVALMGFVIALRFIEGIYKGALLGLQKQVAVNVVSVVIATMRYGGVVAVLAWYATSIKVFFVWQLLSSITSVLVLVFFVYSTLPKPSKVPKFSKQAISEVWRFASGMLGITFLALLLTQIDKVLLSKLITLEAYGYYILAATVAGGLALIAAPTTQAIYPKMVKYVAQEKKQELANLYHQGSQLISVLIAPVAMMLIFFCEDIIYLWSGDINLAKETAPILLPLALGSYLNGLMWMPYQLQLAHGWTSFAVKVNSIAVALLVPAIFWVTPRYGAVGAAWVWALLNAGYVTAGMHYMYKKLLPTEKWSWYFKDSISPLLGAIVIVILSKLLWIESLSKVYELCWFAFTVLVSVAAACLMADYLRCYIIQHCKKIGQKHE